MWCRHCQQDVPAIAPPAGGPPACPRCEFRLDRPTDEGIELDAYEPPVDTRICTRLPPIDDSALAQLHEIGCKLRRPQHVGLPVIASSKLLEADRSALAVTRRSATAYGASSRVTGLGVSVLILIGVVVFAAGIAAMIWSATSGGASYWNEALAATLAGEGALIVGLTWMAARLWNNSRQVNSRLAKVDRRLSDLQAAPPAPLDGNYYRRLAA